MLFVEKGGDIVLANPTRIAILEVQEAFAGLAEELGLKTEEDVVKLCKEVRKECWEERHADHG